MRFCVLTNLILLACLPTFGEDTFVPLFNGKSLDGWVEQDGITRFVVKDGEIVGTKPDSFQYTEREYGDFILTFDVKQDAGLGTYVQFRSHRYTEETTLQLPQGEEFQEQTFPAGQVYGYRLEFPQQQAGLLDVARRGRLEGKLEAPESDPFQENEWNHIRVSCLGDHIQVWVNDVKTVDLVDSADLSGLIGLGTNNFDDNTPKQAKWRNVRIQDLGVRKWQPLWDGKNLEDWELAGDGVWEAKNGILYGRNASAGSNGMLFHTDSFENFTIRFKFNAGEGNSGFFFRCEKLDVSPSVAGFQAEIDPAKATGGLYETDGRGWVEQVDADLIARILKQNAWNEMTVSAHGGRVAVHVNGFLTAELVDDPGRSNGRIAVQVHSQMTVEVAFKDFELMGGSSIAEGR